MSKAALALALVSTLLPLGATSASAHVGDPAPLVAFEFEGGSVEGWTSQYWWQGNPNMQSQGAPASYKSTGGTPGGYYHIDALQPDGELIYVIWDSPTNWGDVSDAFGGSFEIDLKGASSDTEVDFVAHGGNMILTAKLPSPTLGDDGWDHFSLPLDGQFTASNGYRFTLPEAELVSMLATMESIRIRTNNSPKGVELGLDNVGFYSSTPDDGDGVNIRVDNCKNDANADQTDADGDGEGDACDAHDNDGPLGDLDGDGTLNKDDSDHDDGPLADIDGDGDLNKDDNCLDVSNADQADADGDEVGDECDADDNDGPDGDLDGDGSSNELDADDTDGPKADPDDDGVLNEADNCVTTANGDQADADGDGPGDACDENDHDGPKGDPDGDGHPNESDNCVDVANGDQSDADWDGPGDACDENDQDGPAGNPDGDEWGNGEDNCDNAPEDVDGVMDLDGCPDKEVATDASVNYAERPDRIKGALSAKSSKCEVGREVSLFKAKKGQDAKVGSTASSPKGTYGFDLDGRRGKFYVKVTKALLPPNAAEKVIICEGARSTTLKVK